jgi:S1-C subfamily serine protease
MKRFVFVMLVIATTLLYAKELDKSDAKNSIVKIFTVSNTPSYTTPWRSDTSKSTGSGCIIKDNMILTNAHVVTDATYLEVLKHGQTKRYEAKVLYIAHNSDLALITVKDKSFFKGTKALKLGKLPQLQEEVTVYGFPTGGEMLSITKGVISRIEHQSYAHSYHSLLAIQIDAPVNPGNSGGPALSSGKVVGLVMQGRRRSQNIGYIIPTTVIRHFFEDIKDKKYDGYSIFGINFQAMESPVLTSMYQLKDRRYGVLVTKVYPSSPADRALKVGDILVKIGKYNIMTNGKVEFRKGEFTHFKYAYENHQFGDTIECEVIRNGQQKKFQVRLDKHWHELSLRRVKKHESKPTYYIYGGLVFMPLYSGNSLPYMFRDTYPDANKTELVKLQKVLDSELTKGFNTFGGEVIVKVNGKEFKDFSEFVSLLESEKDEFIVFEDCYGYQLVLETKEVVKKHKEILKRYYIKADRSDDLLPKKKDIRYVKNSCQRKVK